MILGFKKQLKQPILDGIKIHTIREDKNNRWIAGRKIHMATGVRTTAMDIFKTEECQGTQKVTFFWTEVDENWTCKVFVDQKHLGVTDLYDLAIGDGFSSIEDFLAWESWNKKDFTGKLIHWTDKKY
jgi:hypothetical protein